jgi:hypothetical protein
MSRTIYIQNSAGIQASNAATVDPNDVATGKVGLLDVENGFVGLEDAGGAPSRFQIVQGVASGWPPISGILEKANIKDVRFRAYEAPANQVTTITPITATADGEVIVRLTRLEQGFEKYPRVAYTIQVEEGDTATEIGDKLRAAITAAKAAASNINNAHIHFVNASGTSTIILTAQDAKDITYPNSGQRFEQISFHTSIETDLPDEWTVANTTAPSHGSGSYLQVRNYEQEAFGNKSFYYTEWRPQTPPQFASDSVTYDLIHILYTQDVDRAINKSFEIHEYVIALPTGEIDEQDVYDFFGIDRDAGSPSPSPS